MEIAILLVIVVGVLGVLALLLFQRGAGGAAERGLDSRLQTLQQSLEAQLGNVNTRLSSVEQGIGGSLATTASTLTSIGTQLGQLSVSTRQMLEMGKSISELQDILRPPQLRGGLGELMLERLLAQILPADNFEMQYRFKSGVTVDAII
ncbi:MAG: hypothetical protein DRI30_05820, partial [Chloroflexi bacterium]